MVAVAGVSARWSRVPAVTVSPAVLVWPLLSPVTVCAPTFVAVQTLALHDPSGLIEGRRRDRQGGRPGGTGHVRGHRVRACLGRRTGGARAGAVRADRERGRARDVADVVVRSVIALGAERP